MTLFERLPCPEPFALTEEQSTALDEIATWRRSSAGGFLSLTGPAGSGKTFLLRHVVERVGAMAVLTAMTGKAALRLGELVPGRETSTLHTVLYYPPDLGESVRFERRRAPCAPFLIVDESSMMAPSVYEDLRAWTAEGVNVLLVGDTFQLPPVVSDKSERER